MKNTLDKKFFTANRQALLQKLKPSSVAVLGSNYPLYTNSDSVLPYVPNHDLYYFTGVEQEETVLVLVKLEKSKSQNKISKGSGSRVILFIKSRNPQTEVWDGKLLSSEEARELSGIDEVLITKDFKDEFKSISYRIKHIYVNWQEHERAPFYRNRNHDFYSYLQKHNPLHKFERLAPLIHELRLFKSEAEVEAIRAATSVSKIALEEVIPLIREEVPEKHVEAGLMAAYIRAGGGMAFSPIVAGGINSCTLHYITNHRNLVGGETLLIDSGARIGRYSADVTRVFPIKKTGKANGNNSKSSFFPVFSKRQEQVYQAVYRMLERCSKMVKTGVAFSDYRSQTVEWVKEELIELKLLSMRELKKNPLLYRKYFIHGVSHWLGLDVHDVGGYETKFAPGMVLTCEPGIYIPEERIGVRLENNLWINPKNPKNYKGKGKTENLTADIPVELNELYQWIQKCSR